MKKIVSFLMFMVMIIIVNAQTFKAPERSTKTTSVDTTTTFNYEVGDSTYVVYKSTKGAFYIYKKSKKTGKLYKYYLPKEIQIKMGRKYED